MTTTTTTTTDDKNQDFAISGRAPKWLLRDWSKVAIAILVTAGVTGGASRVISGDVTRTAEAAAVAAVKSIDPPTKAEVALTARAQAEAVAKAQAESMDRWLAARAETQAERDKAVAAELSRIADQVNGLAAEIRRVMPAKGRK